MLRGKSLFPVSNTSLAAKAGGGDNRLVLVDSGTNTLDTDSKRNLPIVTPKHLNENCISVYFTNGTTVLLMADTVELHGAVIHLGKFPEGLTPNKLRDQCVGDKPLLNTTPLIPLLVVTSAPLNARCGKLKREVISSYLKSSSSPFGPLMTQKGGVCVSKDVLTLAELYHAKGKFPFQTKVKAGQAGLVKCQVGQVKGQAGQTCQMMTQAKAKVAKAQAKAKPVRAKSQEPKQLPNQS